MTIVNDNLYQLMWKSGLLIQYSIESFDQKGKLYYSGEVWGLTFDGKHLIQRKRLGESFPNKWLKLDDFPKIISLAS